MRHWFRWFFSANYRRELAWRKNHFRILVEREPLPMDKGQRVEIGYVHRLTTRGFIDGSS